LPSSTSSTSRAQATVLLLTLTSSPPNIPQGLPRPAKPRYYGHLFQLSALLAKVPRTAAPAPATSPIPGLLCRVTGLGGSRSTRIGSRSRSRSRARARARATSVNGRTRHGVFLHAAPDAEVERRVILLVAAGELDHRSVQGSGTAACDLYLGAAGDDQYLVRRIRGEMEKEGGRDSLPVVEFSLSVVCAVDA
jgi:hypothetical protein